MYDNNVQHIICTVLYCVLCKLVIIYTLIDRIALFLVELELLIYVCKTVLYVTYLFALGIDSFFVTDSIADM